MPSSQQAVSSGQTGRPRRFPSWAVNSPGSACASAQATNAAAQCASGVSRSSAPTRSARMPASAMALTNDEQSFAFAGRLVTYRPAFLSRRRNAPVPSSAFSIHARIGFMSPASSLP